ncbi:hypothetical protein [Pseudomonas paralcaligenes]|nr:hypothetical protein [Pseudomonas paralcaligenes]
MLLDLRRLSALLGELERILCHFKKVLLFQMVVMFMGGFCGNLSPLP